MIIFDIIGLILCSIILVAIIGGLVVSSAILDGIPRAIIVLVVLLVICAVGAGRR